MQRRMLCGTLRIKEELFWGAEELNHVASTVPWR